MQHTVEADDEDADAMLTAVMQHLAVTPSEVEFPITHPGQASAVPVCIKV